MKKIEEKYKKILDEVRNDPATLSNYAYQGASATKSNQLARTRLLVSLYNFKQSSDYDIASYLFDQEIKALEDSYDSIDDYNTEVLVLSALILISFNRIDDILRMFDEDTKADEINLFIDPEFYTLYGLQECYDFLNTSTDPKAKLALENMDFTEEEIDNLDVNFLKSENDDFYRHLRFPLEDVAAFCLEMKEIELLDQVALEWFESIESWSEVNFKVAKEVDSLIESPLFNKKLRTARRQYFEIKTKKDNEKELDKSALKNTNTAGVAAILVLFIGVLGISLMVVMINENDFDRESTRIFSWITSLSTLFLASFIFKGMKKESNKDVNHFKKAYLSGERAAKVSWQYTGTRWSDYAKKVCKEFPLKRVAATFIFIICVIAYCIYTQETLVASLFAWLACLVLVFYFMHTHQIFQTKIEAYLHTSPQTLDIYDRGLVIGKKHYIHFNTRFLWLISAQVIELGDVPYLEMKMNIRGGQHQDANIFHLRLPIPEGKEDEAKKYALNYVRPST